ncbi:MAG: HEAT repeat domain-containing protein, partial [Vicinamibacterales bacterium]
MKSGAVIAVSLAFAAMLATPRAQQTPQTPAVRRVPGAEGREPPTSPAQLKAAIDNLGKFDDATRFAAARAVRRAPVAQAVPALIDAASSHPDGYVRFRALVVLAGFNDPRARDVMLAALDDPNDRLRTVAYAYFEHHPEPGMAPRLLKALDKEDGEFVRPALTRALAAYGDNPAVQTALGALVLRGQDIFRSGLIEALGDYKASYALAQIAQVAQQDGPLQEDAVLALGKIGDRRALGTLEAIQGTAPRVRQPPIAAAFCLLGVNCDSHLPFIVDTVKFAIANQGFQDLLRASARSLGA